MNFPTKLYVVNTVSCDRYDSWGKQLPFDT